MPQSNEPGPYREALELTAELFTVPGDVECAPETIGGVPAEWCTPPGARDDALLLYLHGGAYCMGSITSYRHYVASFARIAGLRTVHIDYRLAPEHPFPAAVEDATAVFRALAANAMLPERIVIAGDSAGGGLALSTLIALRDAGDVLPRAAAVISPWTDLTCSGASWTENQAKDPVIDGTHAIDNARWYLPHGPLDDGRASPLFADLRGLPPLLVHVGTEEVMIDDSTKFVERARSHGVDAEIEVCEGMVHVWHYYAQWIPEAREAIARIGKFFERRLAR
jgi:acetyl esterase/lipase